MARTEQTETEIVSGVRDAANKDEVSHGEGRSDYVFGFVSGDGALKAKTHGMLDAFVDCIQGLLQLSNSDEVKSASAID